MKKPVKCSNCGEEGHYAYACWKLRRLAIKVTKRPKQRSDKQIDYGVWLEETARPYLIRKFGDICACCGSVHYPHDIDHILGKGSHPNLKTDLNNLQILGRYPCHNNKTMGLRCLHGQAYPT